MSRVLVTVKDLENPRKQAEQVVIEDDYFLVTAGECHVAFTRIFGNGTHVLTIKGREKGRRERK